MIFHLSCSVDDLKKRGEQRFWTAKVSITNTHTSCTFFFFFMEAMNTANLSGKIITSWVTKILGTEKISSLMGQRQMLWWWNEVTARKGKLRKTNTYKRNHNAQTAARFKWAWPTARGRGGGVNRWALPWATSNYQRIKWPSSCQSKEAIYHFVRSVHI